MSLGRVGHELGRLICGKIASSWVAVPLMGGISHPMTVPAIPACSRGLLMRPGFAATLRGHVEDGLLTILLGIFKLVPWMRLTM
jgi:hypothetical protein